MAIGKVTRDDGGDLIDIGRFGDQEVAFLLEHGEPMDAQHFDQNRQDVLRRDGIFRHDRDVKSHVFVVEDEIQIGDFADEADVLDDRDIVEVDRVSFLLLRPLSSKGSKEGCG